MLSWKPSRGLWLRATAVALLAVLVFLFVKTEVSGYRAETQALNLVRELRDLDARWDVDARALAGNLAAPAASIPDRAAVIARILHELDQPDARRSLGPALGALQAGVAQKQRVFRELQDHHALSVRAFATAREALQALAAEAPAARARDPRIAAPAAALATSSAEILAAIRGADLESTGELEAALEPQIATLVPAASSLDPRLAQGASRAESAVRELVRARTAQAQVWRRLSFLTIGPRIDLTARELSASIERGLEEKDRWRTYLVFFAAALLLGVGYLAARLVAADEALRAANEDLERRVAERTRDLTRTLEQLKESEAQLVQTEKMSSLGQLVAGVAHEINTPLAYVKSNVSSVRDHLPALCDVVERSEALLSLLQNESADPALLNEWFEALASRLESLREQGVLQELQALTQDGLHGIEQIAELVVNLRNFSRLDRSKVASFNVNDGVNAAFLIARPLLRKIDVEKRLGDVPSITCSPSQVNQVILNLVTNAAQANDKPRGRIVATTRREGADAVAIEIADSGKGITPEHLPSIFDPFFTTKEVGSGTGLGLSIAYKIVKQHGGRIEVSSRVGEGSTFTVILPLQPPQEARQPAAAEAAVS